MPDLVVVLVVTWLIGAWVTAWWAYWMTDPVSRVMVIPTKIGYVRPIYATVALVGMFWPIAVPLHGISVIRKRFGLLSDYEIREIAKRSREK